MEHLGEFIKAKRIKKGLSLRDFAAACDLSHSYLSNIEKGRDPRNNKPISPSFDTLVKIARGLGIPFGDFLTEIDFADEVSANSNEYLKLAGIMIEDELSMRGIILDPEEKASLQRFVSHLIKMKTQSDQKFELVPTVKIPILGTVACGDPIYADQNLLGYEDLPADAIKGGEYFFLIIKGESMTGSRIYPGDKVLIRRQDYVESNQIGLVLVNGDEATLKRVKVLDDKILLIPDNPNFEPMIYAKEDVQIIGRVVKVMFEVQ